MEQIEIKLTKYGLKCKENDINQIEVIQDGEIKYFTEDELIQIVGSDVLYKELENQKNNDVLILKIKENVFTKMPARFWLSNYGTEENIEIFDNYKDAQRKSVDDKVYLAALNPDLVWREEDGSWNYDDKSDLFLETPIIEPILKEKENILKKMFSETPSMICYQEEDDWDKLMSYDNWSDPEDFGFDPRIEYQNLSVEELQEAANKMLENLSTSIINNQNSKQNVDDYIQEQEATLEASYPSTLK